MPSISKQGVEQDYYKSTGGIFAIQIGQRKPLLQKAQKAFTILYRGLCITIRIRAFVIGVGVKTS